MVWLENFVELMTKYHLHLFKAHILVSLRAWSRAAAGSGSIAALQLLHQLCHGHWDPLSRQPKQHFPQGGENRRSERGYAESQH